MMCAVNEINANPVAVRILEIDAEQAGQRVDNFLMRELKGVPKTRVYRLLRKGEVRVNRGRVDASYRLQAGDQLRVPPVRQAAAEEGPARPPKGMLEALERAVVFEDERLLVLDKPAGMAVHGGSGVPFGVIEALRALRPNAPFLELVHRLDRDTSGLLLIAKRRSLLRQLHELLREGGVQKRYLALLAGKLPRGAVPVEAALERDLLQGGERMVRVAADGKASRSVFRTLDRFKDVTLAEVDIATGRTHQIRVHAAHLGAPVIGDEKYGDKDTNRAYRQLGLKRLFLHAHSLRLQLPDQPPLELRAPLSEDLQRVLDNMKAARPQRDEE